ncbi:MAG TPA: HAMP domain-containing sensor histidine kinase [Thermoleophilaceae bacterium]|nr:HAMP domain-containing sensor histidine kinase [Thermoleophilaceae bacterium]
MWVTGWLRDRRIEALWALFAVLNLIAMLLTPDWETIPFHFIWVSLTILYGFRVWSLRSTSLVLAVVALGTGVVILGDAFEGAQLWGELFEVPLMSGMFLAMVWHARRRAAALREMEQVAAERAALLEHQEQLLDDVSHAVRTPVTIARGHLETLQLASAVPLPEVEVAVDELDRIAHIVERLLFLSKADRLDFVARSEMNLEFFLEDIFLRWSEVAPRSWRLGEVPAGTVMADSQALRVALDALLENAVEHTSGSGTIELAAKASGHHVQITVTDDGPGIPDDALGRIFQRFGRADSARNRKDGGAGLGLAIVDAIARAHGGGCSVRSSREGSTFILWLPDFTPDARPAFAPATAAGAR